MKDENKILKWLNNELSHEEIDDLKKSGNFKDLEKIAHYSTQLEAPKVDAEAALHAFRLKQKQKPKVRTLNFRPYLKYAAILVIMLSVAFLTFFNNNKSYNTTIAETETITLPDNSQVMLSAVSSLSYNNKKWKNDRDLELDGEAFFKVSKGKKFTVKTSVGEIQVLGTQFNVKERDNYFEVQCYEGLVAVTYNKKTVKLSKGKSFRVVDNTIELVDDFSSAQPSWLSQESTFDKVPLKHVIADLENYYNIKVETKAIDIEQLFTGTFTHNNKNIALQTITIPLKLSYKIQGDTVTFYKYEN
ncbi:FecR family protein [Lacinutrix sp. 5H-3-7-4]|uniref:FecR family protein n=1 Tax=Lacinutrix sp. (strain 5H-3-7-4) TaxID=983544 RepID=UPI00020A35C6|nr:FecR family protein [Lacinutrix sp. 5H-3-7-4]AEH01322.1 anti-FecI sigma factor, FecR [Lacinutrix sp. 5H-3-7-4]